MYKYTKFRSLREKASGSKSFMHFAQTEREGRSPYPRVFIHPRRINHRILFSPRESAQAERKGLYANKR